jgi:hypothetical protein
MTKKTHILITLVIVMMAVIALSVSTAFAADFNSSSLGTDPGPDPGPPHAPVCYKVESFAPTGFAELQCSDAGKDISNVNIKSNAKYSLEWNEDSVTLRLFTDNRNAVAYWSVFDKAGNVTSGTLR